MEFRTLTADEIELRVGMANAKGFSLLLYKNARVDMQLLDETVGSMGWQRTHEVIDGRLCCTISLWDHDTKQWVKKQDVGTESQTEKDKGQFSDSFKRAGFNVGIGRELYTAPFIWVKGHVETDQRARSGYKADQKYVGGLKVSAIEYSEKRSITKLLIEDEDGSIAYSYGVKRAKPKKDAPKQEVKADDAPQTISSFHAKEIKLTLQDKDVDVPKFLAYFKVHDVDSMTEAQYEQAVEMLRKKQKRKE